MREGSTSAGPDSQPVLPNLERIIRGLLYLYVFSLPFRHLLFVERNGFLILLGLLALWCVVRRRHFFARTPLDVPLIAFVAWVAATIPFAMFPAYSFKEFGKLLQQGLIFYVVAFFFRTVKQRTALLRFIIGGLVIVSAYGIHDYLAGVLAGDLVPPGLLSSTLPAEVWLTTYLVMLMPVAMALTLYEARRAARAGYFVATSLAAVCLVLTQSRAGVLSLLCELWLFGWLLKRRGLLLLAGAVSVAIAAGFLAVYLDAKGMDPGHLPGRKYIPLHTSEGSVYHRFAIWRFALAQMLEHPIAGIGYGKDNFKNVFGQVPENLQPGQVTIRKSGTHNLLLELTLSVGVPGLLLFLWLWVRIIRTARSDTAEPWSQAMRLGMVVGVVGLSVREMFDHLLVANLATQFWILVAILVLAPDGGGRQDADRA